MYMFVTSVTTHAITQFNMISIKTILLIIKWRDLILYSMCISVIACAITLITQAWATSNWDKTDHTVLNRPRNCFLMSMSSNQFQWAWKLVI